MKKSILLTLTALTCSLGLNSCIFQQAIMAFVRAEYPGTRPPMVIADVDGQPENPKWIAVNSNDLPISSLIDTDISYGADNIPYGITSEFSDIVVSPHAPYNQLDYTGKKAGDKVWDPYTRKPFYIPRSYSFN